MFSFLRIHPNTQAMVHSKLAFVCLSLIMFLLPAFTNSIALQLISLVFQKTLIAWEVSNEEIFSMNKPTSA